MSLAESWPLQLSVQPASGPPWSITLDTQALVRVHGQPAHVGALRPGMQVRVQGRPLGPQVLHGEQIQVI